MIAATHRDLPTMIRNSQFREDLFYRLNVFPIEIPPLRERRQDIPLLVHYFVSRLSRKMQKRIRSVPKQAMEALVNADWPGNIRELENFVERCVILTQGDELNVPRSEMKRASAQSSLAAASTFEQAERQVIIDALKTAAGRIGGQAGAAERLGLKRTTLQNKMRKLNVVRADYAN
jgi:formate hydrogenlyase transcriptional activator